MKNNDFFTNEIRPKVILSSNLSTSWLLIFVILLGLMLTSLNINAQSISEKVSFNSENTNNFIVKEFTAKVVDNKIYFRFLIVENMENTNYILESSTNDSDFFPVIEKEGFKSPNRIPLLYCYSLDLHDYSDNVYRIKRITPDGISYSSNIEFNAIENLTLSAQVN